MEERKKEKGKGKKEERKEKKEMRVGEREKRVCDGILFKFEPFIVPQRRLINVKIF